MNLFRSLREPVEKRGVFDPYLALVALAQQQGQVPQTYTQGREEKQLGGFEGFTSGAYKGNGIVFALIVARLAVFTEARFKFRSFNAGRPGDLFGTPDLGLLDVPWPNGTTGDLLARMELDDSLAGNFFGAKIRRSGQPDRLRRLRPDWTTIVMGSDVDADCPGDQLDAEVIGYMYSPGGAVGKQKAVFLPVEDVCHYSTIPDPVANFRGMSWITSVVREMRADDAATDHKASYFKNSATPNMVIKFDSSLAKEKVEQFKELMEAEHVGAANAYKNLFLGGGADATVVGNSFQQMTFREVQGAGETRLAAAANVPPIIAGFSEGLSAATYSNYASARRKFADTFARPHWRIAAASLAPLVTVPSGSELWYDDRDIPFLREDQKDAAEIFGARMTAIKTGVDAGFEPSTVVSAVAAGDENLLLHTGLVSVQLLPPGTVSNQPAVSVKSAELPPLRAVPALVEDVGVADAIRNSDEMARQSAEIDRLTAELVAARAARRVVRDADGLIVSVVSDADAG